MGILGLTVNFLRGYINCEICGDRVDEHDARARATLAEECEISQARNLRTTGNKYVFITGPMRRSDDVSTS